MVEDSGGLGVLGAEFGIAQVARAPLVPMRQPETKLLHRPSVLRASGKRPFFFF